MPPRSLVLLDTLATKTKVRIRVTIIDKSAGRVLSAPPRRRFRTAVMHHARLNELMRPSVQSTRAARS